MTTLGLERDVVDSDVLARTIRRFRETGILLPTFRELADPTRIPSSIEARLVAVDPDAPHPLNLFRVHWHNDATRKKRRAVPEHLVLPRELTGVDAPIVVALGNRFPMIRAHKVLAAYGCLAPRIVTGQFDPTAHRAIWPSTGNYCRGGVAISRIMGCHGVAVLPEGMSRERFAWLDQWVSDPNDIIRTPGTESNVKEIYDECGRLAGDATNVIFNQFCEYGNYLVHHLCTGGALDTIFSALAARTPGLNLAAYVSATGSGGTLAAGDHLKEQHGTRIVAVEALECPTLLYNGFGEHNIQGIGDKHVPLIHNVMNTDLVVAVSDRSTDDLGILFSNEIGRGYLADRKNVPADVIAGLSDIGLSGIANIVAAIKVAKYFGYGPNEAVFTIATDGAEMYGSERARISARHFPRGFDSIGAAEAYGQHVLGAATDHVRELSHAERERVFNLGYYTWVEQQGVSLEDFMARKKQSFWRGLREMVQIWDSMIDETNRRITE